MERLTIAIENMTPTSVEVIAPANTMLRTPYTETKVVEPEVTKESEVKEDESVKKKNRTVPATPEVEPKTEAQESDELDDELDDRPPLTTQQLVVFAREKIAENAKTKPDLKVEIKKKISELGASKITGLDQDGLVKLEKFLSKL